MNEQSLRILWNYNKRSYTHVIGVLEGKEKESRTEKYLKKQWLKTPQIRQGTYTYRFKKLTESQIGQTQRNPRCIIIKLFKTKDEEKSLESSQRKMTQYLQGIYNLKGRIFVTRNHGRQKEEAQCSSSVQRKELSIPGPISIKNILQK